MSAAYELSQLSPYSFEHLVNTLALRELGLGHTGFGPGKDGGRDGYFSGQAPYPSSTDRWAGEWFIQSKFLTQLFGTNSYQWLLRQITDELIAFTKADSKRKWPDIWIIATNIDPTGDVKTGCFARAQELVAKARPGMKFDIWGGQKILSLLQQHPAVARRYGHLLTPGHVLSALYDHLTDERASIDLVIRHLATYWLEEQRGTKLDQAGWKEDRKPGIHHLCSQTYLLYVRCHASKAG